MRDELISFQQTAVSQLLDEINSALAYYSIDGCPQVIAFRASTGSGKTTIMVTIIDILEPHHDNLTDNPSKAKALIDYARKQTGIPIGRLQLIREGKDNMTGRKRMKRLDLMKNAVRAKVMQLQTIEELDAMFLDDNLVD